MWSSFFFANEIASPVGFDNTLGKKYVVERGKFVRKISFPQGDIPIKWEVVPKALWSEGTASIIHCQICKVCS
jgi:hypothetical protein